MLRTLLISILYWTLFLMLLVTIRFLGIDIFLETPLTFPMSTVYLVSLPGGLIMGTFWGLLELADRRWSFWKGRSFGYTIAAKTITYLIVFVVAAFLGSWAGGGSLEFAVNYLFAPVSLGNLIATGLGALMFIFFQQMNRRFGPGVLSRYLTGKYFRPKEEDRIFMFLDLKSSTSIAEELGHIQYSRLIQDCFSDLTASLEKNRGEVYQYVGDEVIVTWETRNGLKNSRCLQFFFDYQGDLTARKEHYQDTYGVIPRFKAGMSSGMATVAEVGELKTEIAYHGDVLNATARIQGYCNELGEELLITESLARKVGLNEEYEFVPKGTFELRGRQELVEISAVRSAGLLGE